MSYFLWVYFNQILHRFNLNLFMNNNIYYLGYSVFIQFHTLHKVYTKHRLKLQLNTVKIIQRLLVFIDLFSIRMSLQSI
jgi:hypothetical protein